MLSICYLCAINVRKHCIHIIAMPFHAFAIWYLPHNCRPPNNISCINYCCPPKMLSTCYQCAIYMLYACYPYAIVPTNARYWLSMTVLPMCYQCARSHNAIWVRLKITINIISKFHQVAINVLSIYYQYAMPLQASCYMWAIVMLSIYYLYAICD